MEVDGSTYTSPNTFLPKKKKKKNEQNIAKVAMEYVSKRIRDEGCTLVHEVCYIMIVNL